MLRFLEEHTVEVDGIGSVCGFSLFDFDRYGDERFGAAGAAPSRESGGGDGPAAGGEGADAAGPTRRRVRSEQGKMEKSFLNFQMNHPDWECGEGGERFIQRLISFQVRAREQALVCARERASSGRLSRRSQLCLF